MEKLTLFEMHFDGAKFGSPTTTPDEPDQSTNGQDETESTSPSGGRRVLRFVVASVLLSIVASVIARRFGGQDGDLEIDEDVEDISVDPIEA